MIKLIQTLFATHLDKFAHLGISSLLYLIIYAITKNEIVSAVIVFLIGLLKEVLDYVFYHGISFGDILSNIVGIVITLFLVRYIIGG